MSSFEMSLAPSARNCRMPCGPRRLGPLRWPMRAKMRRKAKVKRPPMDRTTVNRTTAPMTAATLRSTQCGASRPTRPSSNCTNTVRESCITALRWRLGKTRTWRSPVYVAEDDVDAAEGGDEVGDLLAAGHDGEHLQVGEAGGADVHAGRVLLAVADEVAAVFALRVLDARVGLALGLDAEDFPAGVVRVQMQAVQVLVLQAGQDLL